MKQPWLRKASLILHPPVDPGHPARWALVTHRVDLRGISSGQILLDGQLHGVDPRPTLEELLTAYDAIIRQNTLG